MSELLNLWLFVYAIAKFLAMTGVGLAGAVVALAECCGFRVVALGFEKVQHQVSVGGQLAERTELLAVAGSKWATSPPRKEWRHA